MELEIYQLAGEGVRAPYDFHRDRLIKRTVERTESGTKETRIFLIELFP